MSERVRVLVIDDQNISRGFFELYIQASTRYALVKSLPAAEIAVEFVDRHEVDLIVMDVMMRHGIDGLTAAERIKAKHPEIRIIIATSNAEADWEAKARAIGVESFWYKEYSEVSILEVMDRTMVGESVYPSDPPRVAFGKATRVDLTELELDVLRELTNARTNEEIADRLGIAANTVKRHIQNLMDKTGFDNRIDLAMNAKQIGLVVSEEDRRKDRDRGLKEGRP